MGKEIRSITDKKNAKGKARFLVRTVGDLTKAINQKFTEDSQADKVRDTKIDNIIVVLSAWVDYLSLPWWKRLFTRKPR